MTNQGAEPLEWRHRPWTEVFPSLLGELASPRSCWLGLLCLCHLFLKSGALWVSLATPTSEGSEKHRVSGLPSSTHAALLLILRQWENCPWLLSNCHLLILPYSHREISPVKGLGQLRNWPRGWSVAQPLTTTGDFQQFSFR